MTSELNFMLAHESIIILISLFIHCRGHVLVAVPEPAEGGPHPAGRGQHGRDGADLGLVQRHLRAHRRPRGLPRRQRLRTPLCQPAARRHSGVY